MQDKDVAVDIESQILRKDEHNFTTKLLVPKLACCLFENAVMPTLSPNTVKSAFFAGLRQVGTSCFYFSTPRTIGPNKFNQLCFIYGQILLQCLSRTRGRIVNKAKRIPFTLQNGFSKFYLKSNIVYKTIIFFLFYVFESVAYTSAIRDSI